MLSKLPKGLVRKAALIYAAFYLLHDYTGLVDAALNFAPKVKLDPVAKFYTERIQPIDDHILFPARFADLSARGWLLSDADRRTTADLTYLIPFPPLSGGSWSASSAGELLRSQGPKIADYPPQILAVQPDGQFTLRATTDQHLAIQRSFLWHYRSRLLAN
jgi:hypothetical protein